MSGETPDSPFESVESHAAAEGATTDGVTRPLDILLHTEPDIPVEMAMRDLGVSEGPAHLYIAMRKGLDAVTGAGMGPGMPMAGNLIAGAYHLATPADGDGEAPGIDGIGYSDEDVME